MTQAPERPPVTSFQGKRLRVVGAAVDAGHEITVQREGKRFRLACGCGFTTQYGWTRKHVFDAANRHITVAGLAELEKAGGGS